MSVALATNPLYEVIALMSVHKVQQDILQTIADLGRPSAPYVTDAEITDRLGLDLQEVQDHLKLLENKGYVESS